MSLPLNNPSARGTSIGGIVMAMVILVAAAGIVILVLWGQPTDSGSNIYSYSSVKLPPFDPSMVRYKQVAEIGMRTTQPRGLAVSPAGKLYAVGDDLTRLLDGEKPVASSPTTAAAGFHLPQGGQCVAIDSSERAYVGLKDRVMVVDADFKTARAWPALEGQPDISSIAVTPDGKNVFVADRGNSWVVRYDADGKILGYIGRDEETGKPNRYHTRLIRCFDVALGADGLVRVVEPVTHVVDTYNLAGKLQCSLQLVGSIGCCNPTDIAVLADGKLVASEKGAKVPRVKVYDLTGKLDCIVAGPDSFLQDDALLDLAIDGRGQVYVLDAQRGSVRVFQIPDTKSQIPSTKSQTSELDSESAVWQAPALAGACYTTDRRRDSECDATTDR